MGLGGIGKVTIGEPKPKQQRAKAIKQPKADKPVKSPKSDLNPHGKGWLSPSVVLGVIEDKKAGMKNEELATKYNISVGSVATIWGCA